MSADGRYIDRRLGTLEGEAADQGRPDDAAAAGGSPPYDVFSGVPSEHYGSDTYFDRPVLKEPLWIWTVPVYFYVGGVAGAASVLGASVQLVGGRTNGGLVSRCRRMAAAACAASTVLLILDLGRPERFMNMLRVFRPTSALNMGSWILSASSAFSSAAALTTGFSGPVGAFGDLMGLGAGATGLPLTGYTAVLLADTAVPVWQETRKTLPALFVASSVGSAADLLEMTELDEDERRVVVRFGILGKVAELIATMAVERDASRVERVGRPLKEGLSGNLWRAAKILTGASLGLSVLPGESRSKRFLTAAAGTAGALAVKFAVFHAGKASARDPRATFEQQREDSSRG